MSLGIVPSSLITWDRLHCLYLGSQCPGKVSQGVEKELGVGKQWLMCGSSHMQNVTM
jgi:hypothetical protein